MIHPLVIIALHLRNREYYDMTICKVKNTLMYDYTMMNPIATMIAISLVAILISGIIFTTPLYNVDKIFAQSAAIGNN